MRQQAEALDATFEEKVGHVVRPRLAKAQQPVHEVDPAHLEAVHHGRRHGPTAQRVKRDLDSGTTRDVHDAVVNVFRFAAGLRVSDNNHAPLPRHLLMTVAPNASKLSLCLSLRTMPMGLNPSCTHLSEQKEAVLIALPPTLRSLFSSMHILVTALAAPVNTK